MAYAILFLVLLLADQLTKAAAYAAYGESVDLIKGWLGIEAVPQNTGISFGWFSDEPWAMPVFIGLTCVALVVLFAVCLRLKGKRRFLRVSLVLIMVGAAGNLIDRCVEKGVRDFIYMNFGFVDFHNNVADIAIAIGAVLLVIAILFVDRAAVFRSSQEEETPEEEGENG